MPRHPVTVADPDARLHAAFARIREEFAVPDSFPPEVLAEAERVAADAAAGTGEAAGIADLREVPFCTIDPAGSMDLDQAMHLAREGEGYRVRYAIADVPAFVTPGGAIDAEARRRVETLYLPGERAPLHPPVLGEGAASLLPGVDRRAFVWDLRLDAAGEPVETRLVRAVVRSRRRYDYTQAQGLLDVGDAGEDLHLLAEIGRLRVEAERARGGASLPMPEQEVHVEDGRHVVRFRPPVAVEEYNAQISLLTGMVAARMMLEAGVGILRTMPAPDERDVARFRRQAEALRVPWPKGLTYGELVRGLDRQDPVHLALVHAATGLFRGAAYTAFDGTPPEVSTHAAVAAPYAHVTAPLRRLVDRFGLALCAALSAGEDVPSWVTEALPTLPDLMREGDRRAAAVDRACTDAVEACVLAGRVGEAFEVDVVDDRGDKGLVVQVTDPAVVAPATGSARLGSRVAATLVEADVAARRVRFEVGTGAGASPQSGGTRRP